MGWLALQFSGALANLTIRRTQTRDLSRVAAACGDQGRARSDTHQDISRKHQHIYSPPFMSLANKSEFFGGRKPLPVLLVCRGQARDFSRSSSAGHPHRLPPLANQTSGRHTEDEMDLKLKDKVALITGSTAGIGL